MSMTKTPRGIRSNSWLLGTLTAFVLAGPLSCGGDNGGDAVPASHQEPPPEDPSEVVAVLELEATYPEGFSFLNGVREFSDGTILAADPIGQLLIRIDLDSSTADTLGRVGPGPQEYEQPDQVFTLPGDSSLLVDLGKMQLTAVGPDGTFGEGLPMAIPGGERFPIVLHPRFTDAQGRLYDQGARSRDEGPPDSAALTRFDRGTRTMDTVAWVWLPEYRQTRTRSGGFAPRMLESRDAWAVGQDGRIAIARARDFTVEWYFPDGRLVVGPRHAFEAYPVGRTDKEIVISEMRTSGISMTSRATRGGGVQSMTMSRGLFRGGDLPDVDNYDWAESLPPFRESRALVSPQGELWVERYLPADSPPLVEVFDRRGVHQGSIQLPLRRQVIGFGRGGADREVVYLVWTDEFDLKWLERYGIVR